MNRLTALILALTLFLLPSFAATKSRPSHTPPTPVVRTTRVTNATFISSFFSPATMLLYHQNTTGSMRFACTATIFENPSPGVYRLLSAAHCAGNDDDTSDKVEVEPVEFYVTSDLTPTKTFYQAKLIAVGRQTRGDDFSVFEIHTSDHLMSVPLGGDPTLMDTVLNVASPVGLGKQVFFGTVSSIKMERPAIDPGQLNWSGTVLVQLWGVNGGSSGSAIVCESQMAICGVIVGGIAGTNTVVMPISRFKTFYAASKAGTYPKFETKRKESKNE